MSDEPTTTANGGIIPSLRKLSRPDTVGRSEPPGTEGTIRDAAFVLNMEPREIHALCSEGHVQYRTDHDGAWIVNFHSITEFVRHVTGFGREPFPVRAVEYADLRAHLSRIENKLDTIIEGNKSMTQADNQIEADVSALRASFASLGSLISTLTATVTDLQTQVANGQAPAASTLADLDSVTQQIGSLIPAPVDTTPPADDAPPADAPPADDAPPVDVPVDDTPVDAPPADDVPVDAPVDDTPQVGVPVQSAQPQSP